jgi:hypothetical protein
MWEDLRRCQTKKDMIPTLILEHQWFLSILFTLDPSSRFPPGMRDPLTAACQSKKHHRETPTWSPTSQFFGMNYD